MLLTVKSKEATFAAMLMIADAQSRGRDTGGFRENHYTLGKEGLESDCNWDT